MADATLTTSFVTLRARTGADTGGFALKALFAAVILAVPLAAQARQAQELPREVRAYFDNARQECRQAGGALHIDGNDSYAESAEFNGDGRPDYIVHMAGLYCPPFGRSEYCGSAGCMISILVSDGDRLREVASNNYQDFAITRPVHGRQNLVFAAHGTFCGHKYGADTCFGVMTWTPKGFRTTYVKGQPAALREQDASQTGEMRADKNPKFDWKLIGPAAAKPGPTIAMSDQSPAGMKAVVACAGKVPVFVLSFPPAMASPPPGQHVMVEIGEPDANSQHADIVLQPVQDKPAFIGQLSRAALTIMEAADTPDYASVPVSWTLRGRDYWTDLPGLPLTHFKQSAKAALTSCASALR